MAESHPCTDPNWIELWRDHTREDMIHDANIGTLRYDDMALWRLYGGTKETIHQDGERETRIKFHAASQAKPEIQFYFRKQTDMYTDDGAFNPFGGTAESTVPVGVYHDAGPDIDGKLAGCRTLRMSGFGTPSDPASKPRPFAWQPYAGEISIPGCAFGFDLKVVPEVIIQDFKGTSARYGFSYVQPNGQTIWCDGATGVSTPNKPDRFSVKFVNDRSGYFGGNATNAEMKGNQESVPYYIGKVLGDALQVFGMLPQLPTKEGGWVSNPMYAARVPLSAEPKLSPFPVDQLILNTGDELEYARAVAWKQTALYISPPNKEKIHKAVCTPGISLDLDPVAEYSRFVKRVNEVIQRIKTRFDVSLKSMNASISDPTEIFNSAYSMLGGELFVNTADQKVEARKFMEACIQSTTNVQSYILSKVNELVGGIQIVDKPDATDNDVTQIRSLYTKLNDVLPHWSPSGPIADQGKNRYMVGNVRQKYPVAETEEFTFAIRFKEVFEAIKAGRDYSKFVPNWLAPPPPVMGGRRRRTLRKYKGKRGGAERYGDSQGSYIYNAFTGMINAGLSLQYQRSATVDTPDVLIPPRQDSLYYEFLAESEVDASLDYRKAEFANFKSSNPPIENTVSGVQTSGYTTFTDFIEFACGYESNTLPPPMINATQIEYAISLIEQSQSSKQLRDQALLVEMTDTLLAIEATESKDTDITMSETIVPSAAASVPPTPPVFAFGMSSKQVAAPNIPFKQSPFTQSNQTRNSKRRLSSILPLAPTTPQPKRQNSGPVVYGGRRTFRRRLPKLI
jgi:hypothetical protein